jgi:hypothetical protein
MASTRSYRSRLAVATYYIDENGRDCAMTRIESVKSLYGLEKQSIAPCM